MLPTVRDSDSVGASLHCAHNSPNTTLSWYRGSEVVVNDNTRTIHSNGTLEFHPLIANADLNADGIEYHCRLSNPFGSVISRTAILKLASKLICCVYTVLTCFKEVMILCYLKLGPDINCDDQLLA